MFACLINKLCRDSFNLSFNNNCSWGSIFLTHDDAVSTSRISSGGHKNKHGIEQIWESRTKKNNIGITFLFLAEVSARAELQGQVSEKDGEEYMSYTDVKLKVHVGGGTVRLENLFNGDKVLCEYIFYVNRFYYPKPLISYIRL